MSNPRYKVGDKIKYRCIYNNDIAVGEILNIRQANLNWDYSIRYEVFVNLVYVQWVKEQDIIERVK